MAELNKDKSPTAPDPESSAGEQAPRTASVVPGANGKRSRKELWRLVKATDFDALTDRELYSLMLWSVLSIVLGLALFFTILNPGPPKVLMMSTGATTGAYYGMAQEYKLQLKKHGIQLEIAESSGSLQNLERLRNKEPLKGTDGKMHPVMAAFVQSGTGTQIDQDREWIESLASVAYEPIWVFHTLSKDLQRLAEFRGKRVAIGAPGSGAQFAALKLLEKTGIDAANTTFLQLGPDQALEALQAGRADAIVLVAAPTAKAVALALEKNISLLNFGQAEAYLRNFAWLQKITLPRGSADLIKDLPPNDVTLIAATANLAVSADLHPSLAYLLLDVASEVHAKAGLTQTLREFPSERSLEFRQSGESKRYFKTGRPFLQHYLPFWLANLADRLMTGLVPLLLIILPMIKLVPAFLTWREKSRVSRLYSAVSQVEADFHSKRITPSGALSALDSIDAAFDRLEPNSQDLAGLYHAKAHLELLRTKMRQA